MELVCCRCFIPYLLEFQAPSLSLFFLYKYEVQIALLCRRLREVTVAADILFLPSFLPFFVATGEPPSLTLAADTIYDNSVSPFSLPIRVDKSVLIEG